jgi:hypothetical protein
VIPFKLRNAPVSSQQLINDILWSSLNRFCTPHLDDIFIDHNNMKKHMEDVGAVMQILIDAGLYLQVDKFDFHKEKVK